MLNLLLLLQAQKSLDITYIANDGYLISSDTNKILIDGIFKDGYGTYYTPTAQTITKERNATAPFDSINILLVTHSHADHVDPAYLTDHMVNDNNAMLIVPTQVSELLKPLGNYSTIKNRIDSIKQINQSKTDTTIHGIRVKSMVFTHPNNFTTMQNLGYVCSIDGFKIFHPGDATSKDLSLFQSYNLANDSIDIAFIPYWFFDSDAGNLGKDIISYLKPKAIVIIHIGLGKFADYKNIVKNTKGIPPVYFLEAPMQKFNFIKEDDTLLAFQNSKYAYLGQTPPADYPKLFLSGMAERIAISSDGKEIYYGINGIKCYRFYENKWNGPSDLFNTYIAPALSLDGDIMYFQDGNVEAFYSTKSNTGWNPPVKFLNDSQKKHYLQVTSDGSCYLTTDPKYSVNGDISKLVISNSDTVIQSLASPINKYNGLDFFISRDKAFMIFVNRDNAGTGLGDLYISYSKTDGSWTNPKNLGNKVNMAGGWEWGPFVTNDNKYLFYTSGQGGSNPSIYWVRVDKMIDSLRHTNFVPWLKVTIKDSVAIQGTLFTYTLPANTFIDDDGNNTLTYDVKLTNGSDLPLWLDFNKSTRTFSGTPSIVESLNVRVTASDTAKTSVYDDFKIEVKPATALKELGESEKIKIFPNPNNGKLNIVFGNNPCKRASVKLSSTNGRLLFTEEYQEIINTSIDLKGIPQGIYLVSLCIDGQTIKEKVIIR